jgi:DHA1 family 2-module integral membrane pump EmrD-like MFS transporter
MKENNNNVVFIAMLMSVLTIAAMDLYVPSLPAMMIYFSVSASDVQWLIAIYMVGFSVSHIVYGPLSDHYGRRPILLVGLAIASMGSLVILVAPHFYALLVGRLVQGIGFAAGSLLARAILSDCFKNEALAKVGSTVGLVVSVTVGLAPSMGGFLQLVGGWKFNFGAIFILTLFSIIYVFIKLPETNQVTVQNKISFRLEIRNYLSILMNRKFFSNTLIAGLAFGGILTYAATAPFIIQTQLLFNPFQFGLFSFLIAIAQMLGYIVNGKIVVKHGALNSMFLGSICLLIGALILIVFASIHVINIFTLMAGVLLFVFGTGFIYANAYSMAFSLFNSKMGNTAAIYGLVQLGCAFLVSFILTLIVEKTMLVMGVVCLFLATLIFIILFSSKMGASSSHNLLKD